MKSIENDRQLALSGHNPFETEHSFYNKEKKSGDIDVTVVVPDFYHVALPNLGHQMVEHQLTQANGFHADRSYLNHDYSLLKEQPDSKPEIVFVSMSYEGSYIRSVRMLDLMGIPLRRRERSEQDPLVIFGGWSVSRNPLPLFDLADVICIGDSEHSIESITSLYKQYRGNKVAFFEAISKEQGLIIPSRYQVATQNGYLSEWKANNASPVIHPSKSTILPHSWYLSSETDYNDIGYYEGKTFFSMEIVDACASKCAFCASGFKEKNRDIQDPKILADLAEWAAHQGADLTKLFFPANSSAEATKAIMRELIHRGLSPRVGSAKAEKIDLEYIQLVGQSGQEKIAFAPETGDYDLRKHLGKPGMTNEVLENVIKASIDAGIPNLDFYLILNLPGEAPDSFKKSIDMLGQFHHLATSRGLKGRVRVSTPNFFPKAWTPFQYAESGSIDTYSEKVATLNTELGGLIAISTMQGSVDLLSQNIMSRGGIEVGELLIEVYSQLQAREQQAGQYTLDTFEDWRAALTALHLDENTYFSSKDSTQPLPWHHIHLNQKFGLGSVQKVWEVFKGKRSLFMID